MKFHRVAANSIRLWKPLALQGIRAFSMNFEGAATELLGTKKPPFIYGTAWKKDQTKALVKQAIKAGFTAIDTAAQPKHYQEVLVGDALREILSEGLLSREQIYLQTKFTPPAGQNKTNMPYDPNAPLKSQVHTSIASSLENLRPKFDLGSVQDSYIDCLVLHSPLETIQDTLAAWNLFESYVPQRIRRLGISNTDLAVLKAVYDGSRVKPSVVQNRFYNRTAFDVDLRAFCREHGIVYQSFWTLTGNPGLLRTSPVALLSKDAGVSKELALYALVMSLGIAPLNGTTSEEHMKQDLTDIARLKNWTFVYSEKWSSIVADFKALIGDAS
ncbi:hypothetical protein, variant [Verruconis gallopava]|uniref:NADP-dependent oxidoreductase domain-containing protein n=1 Tax=Verruconis gallopava TaxID=253628 RepID=A0A0D2AAR1_9PEZI|nr:uncharacterized protein PV09_05001 [Verruconis gallopava]XP_016213550.1 hypothetical protein, variant [Verruconis gallopava]KIW03680.1 hypothetical protein PV09_05001 [Verruconis gallopava]KIW03681.1 hypothetical protein, variant [Verruconis gallopava]